MTRTVRDRRSRNYRRSRRSRRSRHSRHSRLRRLRRLRRRSRGSRERRYSGDTELLFLATVADSRQMQVFDTVVDLQVDDGDSSEESYIEKWYITYTSKAQHFQQMPELTSHEPSVSMCVDGKRWWYFWTEYKLLGSNRYASASGQVVVLVSHLESDEQPFSVPTKFDVIGKISEVKERKITRMDGKFRVMESEPWDLNDYNYFVIRFETDQLPIYRALEHEVMKELNKKFRPEVFSLLPSLYHRIVAPLTEPLECAR